ncbi:hypothetical protein BJ085DRAFT_29741 [Dimargaris cristalligena]|uniref:Uncharacterized protein n=1 Tax=Dimargaris cristalligena TaxID=215637 RepID=A0A4Q0A3G3_9FUNG|nr:hypothetical protein BJ085DRAFT_29741 [Dimargaris cristalligena]|eukprot:RKP40418.1 hypothetical protein BJ085DRAFT_29741 [Dimargaris cristalligena]
MYRPTNSRVWTLVALFSLVALGTTHPLPYPQDVAATDSLASTTMPTLIDPVQVDNPEVADLVSENTVDPTTTTSVYSPGTLTTTSIPETVVTPPPSLEVKVVEPVVAAPLAIADTDSTLNPTAPVAAALSDTTAVLPSATSTIILTSESQSTSSAELTSATSTITLTSDTQATAALETSLSSDTVPATAEGAVKISEGGANEQAPQCSSVTTLRNTDLLLFHKIVICKDTLATRLNNGEQVKLPTVSLLAPTLSSGLLDCITSIDTYHALEMHPEKFDCAQVFPA